MRTVFQQELGEVQSRLVTLANEAKTIMEKASKAFLNSDVAMADEALALTDANEERALDLDELVIKVLATQSPVARDLRILVSALRMSASLERMGSLASHIAAIARYRYPGSAIPDSLRPTFEEMARIDIELAGKAANLLENTDLDLAREIQARDEAVDMLHRKVFDVVLSPDWSENAMFTVDVTLASRYFERFADHVVDISSKVSFLQTGEWQDPS
ncbi:MAG: phosphate signaling complex protein PhoU [Aquiluna sp.]|jgi:phosphate transport system protein|uniref:phosphate signaling complex protein PhoU n=1 Tax=Aquiluna sp. TaxID=2053504 RepID=UPI0027594B64|nr:phosphate signaling complex protein PhoU [Aquiluna sp.]MDP4886524.1 phosphate signaling complex protein PhoU [Aquiluna sp.]MDP5025907.1 phosphate signaling complex protein PhoU [Aquiluna sp.]